MIPQMHAYNSKQLRAVEAGDGPIVIIAGPGTGKTKTLTARIAYLLQSGKATAGEILALTFTKKAAQEMTERVQALLPGAPMPHISTFHALCYELLGSDQVFVGESERLSIIKNLSKPADFKGLSTRELALIISRSKNEPAVEDATTARLVSAYNSALQERNVRDFDDILLQAYTLLQENIELRQMVQNRYKYILVDEFQDTNQLQYALLNLLRGTENVFVIGDPNQSIYGFRGASGTIFAQFVEDFPQALTITLQTNYRSTPQIVAVGNAIFPDGPLLQAAQNDGEPVQAVEVLNEYSEAQWVLGYIQQAIGGSDFTHAVSHDDRARHRTLKDFAVLYRSRSAAQAFQKVLAESGLPYQIVGDGSPYDQPQVQMLIAALRATVPDAEPESSVLKPQDTAALNSILGKATASTPSEYAQKAAKAFGFEIDAILQQFLNTLVRFQDIPTAAQYFDTIAEQGFYDPSADAITLLTIHASKGLEFPVVFVLGCEEGIVPSAKGDIAEERRLFYVAVTRAKQQLTLTYGRHRVGKPAAPSQFITSLPKGTLERFVDPGMQTQAKRIAKKAIKRSQQSLFG